MLRFPLENQKLSLPIAPQSPRAALLPSMVQRGPVKKGYQNFQEFLQHEIIFFSTDFISRRAICSICRKNLTYSVSFFNVPKPCYTNESIFYG